MKLLLKVYFFVKPNGLHPFQSRYPKKGKETSRDYENDWEPLNWKWKDFNEACNELITLLETPNKCAALNGRKHKNCNFKTSNKYVD